MLAADFLGAGSVTQLAWQGDLVDVNAGSWIVRAVAEAGDTSIMLNAATLGSAGLYNATIMAGGSTMNVPVVVAP